MKEKNLRFFNTTGPCNPEEHYMLSPEERLVGEQLSRYIKRKLYWVLHAPQQTGKTTFLHAWMREINTGGEFVACYVTVERCRGISDPKDAIPAICNAIKSAARACDLPEPETINDHLSALSYTLEDWSKKIAPKPLIVLFDDVDVLVGEALISFLCQLRGGFASRGIGKFPTSIALVGMRDLKDYITESKDAVLQDGSLRPYTVIGRNEAISFTGVKCSPFNIKEDSARLVNFSENDISRLFAQRTKETGQQITPEALKYVFEQSGGHPWIVNSLFKRAILRILKEGSTETVTIEHVREAREQMVMTRETHLDALAYLLDDDRVRRVIESIMIGKTDTTLAKGEPFRLCLDLGLVTIVNGTPTISNPIYSEVLAREITYAVQLAIPAPEWCWQKDDGSLDIEVLMREFQKFWHRHSKAWEEQSGYTEVFPHLVFMAFLQRVINDGGYIDREFAAGSGRLDLSLYFKNLWYIIEIKIICEHDSTAAIREEGLTQIARYRDRIDPSAQSYLVIFDRRKKSQTLPWEQKIKWETAADITILWQ